MSKELREQIADICRTGYHGAAETKVVNQLLELITKRESDIVYQAIGALKLGMDMNEWASHKLTEIEPPINKVKDIV